MNRDSGFLWGDWIRPVAVGLIMSCLMGLLLWFGRKGDEVVGLANDIAALSASFSFTFIGVLLTFYSLLQVLADKEWIRKGVAHTPYWSIFKENLLRVIRLLVVLFFISILYKGAYYLDMKDEETVSAAAFGVSSIFTLLACFLMSVVLVRIYMTASTFISIVTADGQDEA